MTALIQAGSFVSAQDYNGFGSSSREEVENLRKALFAGADVVDPGASPGQGFPLRVESLEATLKNQTFELDEIKLFKTIPKVPATNTAEEFNRLESYSRGGSDQFNLGWMTEGDLPEEEDSTYSRQVVFIKFLGVVGRVTHVANVIRPAHGNVVALETMNKTMAMLQQLENSLFFGDSSLIPEQIDGLQKLIMDGSDNENVIDLRGAPLLEETLNDALLQIRDNFGYATDLYINTGPFADLARQVYDRQRFGSAPQPGVLGTRIHEFQGQHGRVNLHDSVFIRPGAEAPANGVGVLSKRPNAATITVQPSESGSGSQFSASDAGTYTYRVVAANRYGRSVPVTTSSVVVSAGEEVTFTVADGGGGAGTTYYEIYRSTPGGGAASAKLMTRVARTGATQVITDTNADIPGTSNGFLLMQNSRSFSWAQLLPMTRIPLATIDTSIRWAQVLYGGIKMYAPRKNLILKNIGKLS